MIDWSADKVEFLRRFCRNYTDRELAILFNLEFGTDASERVINSARKRHGLHTGRDGRFQKGIVPWNRGIHTVAGGRSSETRFKKGAMPQNWVPVGSISQDQDGYLKQKVSDDRTVPSRFNWKFVHVIKWEEYNGRPVPEGHCVRFLDMDQRNFAQENLILVSKAENCVINRWSRLDRFPEDARAVVVTMAKLKVLASKRAKDARGL